MLFLELSLSQTILNLAGRDAPRCRHHQPHPLATYRRRVLKIADYLDGGLSGGTEAVVSASKKTLPAMVNIEVTITGGTTIGSGFIIREDGYILTNNHVVADARSIKVSLLDGKVLDGRVIGTDPDNDLAVIKIEQTGLPVAEMGNSADLVVGELAIAMGSWVNPVRKRNILAVVMRRRPI